MISLSMKAIRVFWKRAGDLRINRIKVHFITTVTAVGSWPTLRICSVI